MAKVIWSSEKELEDYIFESVSESMHNPITDESVDSIYRQVDLGSYGIADLVTFSYGEEFLEVTIIELKKETIDIKTMAQLSRYYKAFCQYFEKKHPSKTVSIKLIAVSGQICHTDDSAWLSDYLSEHSNFQVYLCDFDLDSGVIFSEQIGWYKKGEEFTKLHDSIGEKEVEAFNGFCDAVIEARQDISELTGTGNGEN